MPTKKKTAKKYDLKRSDIQREISELVERLSAIDTNQTAPADVADDLEQISDDLEDLRLRVGDEQF